MPTPPPTPLGVRARHKAGGARRRLKHYRHMARLRLIGGPAPGVLYRSWVADDAAPTPPASIAGELDTARISILMAVHDPPIEFLREALESVQRQTSPVHELILSDDGSKDPHVQAVWPRGGRGART